MVARFVGLYFFCRLLSVFFVLLIVVVEVFVFSVFCLYFVSVRMCCMFFSVLYFVMILNVEDIV